MSVRKRYKVTYVLDSCNDQLGHRLDANCLVLGRYFSEQGSAPVTRALYSGGRDGQLFGWDIGYDYGKASQPLAKIQAHSAWVNDIALTHDSEGVISCSSDSTVKLWKPHVLNASCLSTIGEHTDYVKRVSIPKYSKSPLVASGGLDKRIIVWDYNVGQEVMRFEQLPDCSLVVGPRSGVYSLAANNNIIANGGLQKDIQLWDCVSKKRITDLVGHTDNVRDILISDDGRTILTASSDATIKLWSLRAQKCLFSFIAHSDSVWALYSEHPDLKVFYAGDRSGLITRTDIRNQPNNQSCTAICKQDAPVSDIVARQSFIWSTSRDGSILRWKDEPLFNQDVGAALSKHTSSHLSVSSDCPSRHSSDIRNHSCPTLYHDDAEDIYYDLHHTESYSNINLTKTPDYVIHGGIGLLKYRMLGDRRHVLTEDAVGNKCLWDILACKQAGEFDKSEDFEKIVQSLDTVQAIPRWASVNCLLGILAVTLDENHYMDAEIYADECPLLKVDSPSDKRINLGVWILKNLFREFIDAELHRDLKFRQNLDVVRSEAKKQIEAQREEARKGNVNMPSALSPLRIRSRPSPLSLPPEPLLSPTIDYSATPFPLEPPPESPGPSLQIPSNNPVYTNLTDTDSMMGAPDYFSIPARQNRNRKPHTEVVGSPTVVRTKEIIPPKVTREGSFMGRLKKLGRSKSSKSLQTDFMKASVERAASSRVFSTGTSVTSPQALSKTNNTVNNAANTENNTLAKDKQQTSEASSPGTPRELKTTGELIEDLHEQYVHFKDKDTVLSLMKPPNDDTFPMLNLSSQITVIISEESPEAGNSRDIYRSTLENMADDIDLLENIMPFWLGRLLLLNEFPSKTAPTVNFTLQPFPGSGLPLIVNENTRLSASAMLRAQKIMDYSYSKLSQQRKDVSSLQFRCKDVVVTPKMTLATVKARIWRSGDDVVFHYDVAPRSVSEIVDKTQSLNI
ncbi:WD repeat protein, human WDR48 family Bun107 [Schizosaccharomyces pombe]|uniref:UBP9-binding protein bun107 n=1 Tax=Schizosaccharomyces pombe (strain 972 / ATCC 24843) TaxID=284812 RepID=BU107_SCHPO|nr:WD repeat-containing protein [Schizosaccharomyces pombe]Q09731.1 RecName: Full=UBP9-binding protein bun107; AltName: Full=Binding ubp9 protein of 107 kDa [Schizosaccharomyces pombe 972h-]CAA90472.1 WD repeat protein, human WDR48 family Bun107 [Schizosaccharomyces pombe]|eukprot:NP_592926.1 WD repeat-containing protein [Schizosaccharomyces pombe]